MNDEERSPGGVGTFAIGGDVMVNRLGFGAMRLSVPLARDDSTGSGVYEEMQRVLHRVVELGINLIDTADFYGPETNEKLIHDALYPYPEGVSIATKGGAVTYESGGWGLDGRPEHLREACEASMKRLELEQIDLYQYHDPDPDVPFEESIGALSELRNEGKVRHIGISNVTLEQLDAARSIVPISSVQNRYSIAKRDDDDLVNACERYGVAYLPYHPLDAGNLSGDGSPLDEIAAAHGATAKQIALAWLLHRSPVIVPIPGTTSRNHLEQNVAAAKVSLDEYEMRTLGTL